MHLLLYNIFIALYRWIIHLARMVSRKAQLFTNGRRKWASRLKQKIDTIDTNNTVWFHCASLGEFEQARPIIEALKIASPERTIVLTFFSPSGYEVRKKYDYADVIAYLPLDTSGNARLFLDITKPSMAVFVKYEFWYHYLYNLHQRNIPTILIAALFQERHPFFKWYGKLHRKMLQYFAHLFVQNEHSAILLQQIDVHNVTVAGDPRFDRAWSIAQSDFPSEVTIKAFQQDAPVIVAGSTWHSDTELLKNTFSEIALNYKIIIAPHKVDAITIAALQKEWLEYQPILWSQIKNVPKFDLTSRVLIIDTIGILAFIYRYATVVWIGGGFTKTGIHNSVEAAVYQKPLFWGPRFNRYQEALDMITLGAAQSLSNSQTFTDAINTSVKFDFMAQQAYQYVTKQLGASEKIVAYLLLK